ncbi:trans-sialidase, putative [Trypanosoma cruzi marinkellei]|uniref:Trans-sialidase, putative n=1 Tax=Trypanosoma cruzi marinkellei TaxID=85056 RepID=K2NTA9_TRYCR|nr:trans-sialidase, putative [Trypanosoma cruzi marinkellei]
MHSRVAAVKAPRTHNRRRVTGSSGRRREGRESERQRPNMSRRVFTCAVLLLLLVMMWCSTGGAAETEGQQPADPQFTWKGIKGEDGVTVESLGVPGLLKVGSDVFAVAEAQCKKGTEGDTFTGIASQLLTKSTAGETMELLKDPKDKAQVLEESSSEDAKRVDVSRPTTVVNGNDIYMLVGKYSPPAAVSQKSGAGDLGFLLVKGNVIDESGGGKRIQWKNNNDVSRVSFNEQTEPWTRLIGGGGSGVHTGDGRLLFPVEGTKKKSEDVEAQENVKAVSLLIYTLKDTKSWTLSNWMSDGGCSDPSVVEWEKDNQLMMMTACDDGRRRVYESGDKGESWTEALGTLSCVWGNKQGGSGVRNGFITATIGNGDEDNRNVMLVTLPVYSFPQNKKEEAKLHLWLTDNTHIVDIGPVSGDDDVAASSLLYNSETKELIALYEKKNDGKKPSPDMVSVLLTKQLQRVKEVLATWKKVDERVSQLCPTLSAGKDRSSDAACSPDKITAGLVGFLSGNFSDNTWRDEYLGVNATVNNNVGVEQADNGVTFTGRGAGAEWPVGRQGENQLYHFANYNFTLVATVSIHKMPEGDTPIPLIGVKMNDTDRPVLLGLSYNSKGKKWQVLCGDGNAKELSGTWERDETHQVAILLRNGTKGSAYVDGQSVCGEAQTKLENTALKGISHFYIGGDGGSAGSEKDVSVTVTNVLLYNRPLDDTEIKALNANKVRIPTPKDRDTSLEDISLTKTSKPAAQKATSLTSTGGPQSLGKESPKGGEAASGSSKSAKSELTNPLPGAKTAQHLASRTPSGVSINAEGDSFSDDGQSMVTEAGDKTQNDGSPQSTVANVNAADTNAPTNKGELQGGPEVTPDASARTGENEEATAGTNGQEEQPIDSQVRDVNATALNSSLGNLSHGNNTDASTVRESGLLPSLPLLLGLWGFAAL